jgi:hypothetical protein
MKRIFYFAALFTTISFTAFSQESTFDYHKDNEIKTILSDNRHHGFYGSFTMGYTLIDNRPSFLMGGRLSWLPGQSLGIGIGGEGFMNEFHYEPAIGREVSLAGGYGGFYIEPIIFPQSPVHVSFPVLLGGGGVSYISSDYHYHDNYIEDYEMFMVIMPSAEIELNLTRFFRLAMGASYRFTTPFYSDSAIYPISIESLRSWSYTMTFKFGKF